MQPKGHCRGKPSHRQDRWFGVKSAVFHGNVANKEFTVCEQSDMSFQTLSMRETEAGSWAYWCWIQGKVGIWKNINRKKEKWGAVPGYTFPSCIWVRQYLPSRWKYPPVMTAWGRVSKDPGYCCPPYLDEKFITPTPTKQLILSLHKTAPYPTIFFYICIKKSRWKLPPSYFPLTSPPIYIMHKSLLVQRNTRTHTFIRSFVTSFHK